MDTTNKSTFIDRFLTSIESVKSSDAVQYGRKGMRWGVTTNADGTTTGTPKSDVAIKATPGKKVKTSGGKERPASEDAIKAAVGKQIAKKSSTDALSNQELQQVVQRMQLEASYKKLSAQNVSAGRKFLNKLFTDKNTRSNSMSYIEAGRTAVLAKQVGDSISTTKL